MREFRDNLYFEEMFKAICRQQDGRLAKTAQLCADGKLDLKGYAAIQNAQLNTDTIICEILDKAYLRTKGN